MASIQQMQTRSESKAEESINAKKKNFSTSNYQI